MNVGIFLPNWIGDVVMATPTLRALRRHYGSTTRIVGIMRPYVADVLVGTPFLDDRLFFDPRSKNRDLNGWQFAQRLRRERFDAVILLTNSLRTAFWARVSGARQRIGYARDVRSFFLTDKLHAPMAGGDFAQQPTLDYYLQIAYALGCPRESSRMELVTTPADEELANRAWQTLEIPSDRPVVLLNSGAAFGASKLWPTEYFAELARRIARDWNYTVLAICGPREREIARTITRLADDPRVLSLADERLGDEFPLPIGLSKACVRRATLMVTTDSGPRHFAAAFDVPVITLFGPTPISLSETHFAKAVNLHHAVPCGPCLEQVCPLKHHQCMRDLSVERVYQAVAAQLSGLHDAAVAQAAQTNPWGDENTGGGPLVLPPPPRYRATIAPTGAAVTALSTRTSVARRPRRSLLTQAVVEGESSGRPSPGDLPCPVAGQSQMWTDPRYRDLLTAAGLTGFKDVMAWTGGHLMRSLPDRENWRLTLRDAAGRPSNAFLKKHHQRTIGTWVRARLGLASRATPGRIEAENVARLAKAGIPAMAVMAFGEQLHTSGLLESFVLTAELTGYAQLDHFLRDHFAPVNDVSAGEAAAGARLRDPDFDRLLVAVAELAGRLHRQGFNHRDLYCCHFFVREVGAGGFDARLIDLQRVQHRARWRRRWVVKDLAQLSYSAPRGQVSRSRRLAFFKVYLGVPKLRPQDKRFARSVLRKQRAMESKLGPYS